LTEKINRRVATPPERIVFPSAGTRLASEDAFHPWQNVLDNLKLAFTHIKICRFTSGRRSFDI